MPARVYKTDKDQLLAEGQLIVSSTDDSKYQHKVEMVNIVLGGMPPSELSEYVSESKNTITSWVKTADEKGFEALRVKKQPGRPMKLSAEDLASIKSVLEEDDPKKYGYNVWDGPSLSNYIKKTYGADLCVRQCQRMFHNLGLSLVRPQTFPSKNKEGLVEEREEFKKTEGDVRGRVQGRRLSGRGTLPGDDFRHEEMGPQRIKAEGALGSGPQERPVQWLRRSRDGRAHHDQTFLVQLRNGDPVLPRLHRRLSGRRREEDMLGH